MQQMANCLIFNVLNWSKKFLSGVFAALRDQIRFACFEYCGKMNANPEGGTLMASLTKPLNILVVCAVFAFIGAILLGAL